MESRVSFRFSVLYSHGDVDFLFGWLVVNDVMMNGMNRAQYNREGTKQPSLDAMLSRQNTFQSLEVDGTGLDSSHIVHTRLP